VHHHDDNETWLIETGHNVMEKKAAIGIDSLSPLQRLKSATERKSAAG
jgi:hypothetical protein